MLRRPVRNLLVIDRYEPQRIVFLAGMSATAASKSYGCCGGGGDSCVGCGLASGGAAPAGKLPRIGGA